jgi:V-type H+-transporting ATPase subunit a
LYIILYCPLEYNQEAHPSKHSIDEDDLRDEFEEEIDPVWLRSTEEIAFMNSFKMKLAIILGVTQMVFGVILKGFNTL